jgi:hypothetical protein
MVVAQMGNLVSQFGKFQVMGGNQAIPALLSQSAYVGPAANQAFAVVCAAKDLVDQKEQRE